MPKKNRGYKRGEAYRDSRLFVIACEGEKREKNYFFEIHKRSQRIRIKVLEPKPNEVLGKSAPKWLLDKAISYVDEFDLTDSDSLWFVLDVDRWGRQQIGLLTDVCKDNSNWNIAISNPCFEVWLYMHLKDIQYSKSKNCHQLKHELHKETSNKGYNAEEFVSLIKSASQRARASDTDKNHDIPKKMESKMYLLAESIITFAGNDLG